MPGRIYGEDLGGAHEAPGEDSEDENEAPGDEDLGDEGSEGLAADGEGSPGEGGRGGLVVRYAGGLVLEGVPTRKEIVAECDAESHVSAMIREHAGATRPVFFMPVDVEEVNEYVKGVPVYALRLFGAMMDGSKAEVMVTGIDVFFDVAAPARAGQSRAQFDASLRGALATAEVTGATVKPVDAYPSRGYHTAPAPYRRVYTANVQQRKRAIAAVREAGMETASDDRTCYYRKAAREYGLPLSDWAVLHDYEYAEGPTAKSPLCAHTFRVPVAGFRALIDAMAPKAKREAATRTKEQTPLLARDRTLVVAWDIETHTARGEVPLPEHDGDVCFMICLTAHWKDDPAPLRQVCIVDVEAAPDPGWTTVVCGSPANVLRAFALSLRALAPDVLAGFNDSNYDWPFVVEKARRLGVLGWAFDRMTAAPRRRGSESESDSDSVLRWNYSRDQKVKISAEEVFFSNYLKVPGCVPIDVRVCYKKLYPKSETPKAGSLKFYLEVSGLAGKADMPIKRMWRYYEAARAAEAASAESAATGAESAATCAEHMRRVGHYCVVDALRCQQLLVRRNVINDYREVSSLAFVSLFDSHYFAGGMKVCNLLSAYAWRRNILPSMIPLEREEGGKYPGAYVFPPEKGVTPDPQRLAAVELAAAQLRAQDGGRELDGAKATLAAAFEAFAPDRPVTGLDFASLYPSLIMTYNLSPEKILTSAAEADRWRAQGRRVHPIEFPFNGRTVRGWSVLHENRPEEVGLYPSVLLDLFAKRAEVKARLGAHGAVKELLELVFSRAGGNAAGDAAVAGALRCVLAEARAERDRTAAALAPGAPPPPISPGSTLAEELADLRRLNRNALEQAADAERVLARVPARELALAPALAPELAPEHAPEQALAVAVRAEYARACFDWTCANTKQNALKVYMNTFYGEAGNSLSPFFQLELAGGVTSAGQYNIKLVADFVRSKGFRIKYGDTDSLYLVAPSKYFEDCDADFAAGRVGREEWMAAMVRITMRALNQIRDEVNGHLRADNGSPYLKMAYEEVLYPVVFTGKKKYFGVPHLNGVNFRPEKLFIRGIDVVKQGQPGLAREIGYRIMWACMALDNTRAVRRIVEDVLRDAVMNGAQWNFEHFVKTDAWKPLKDNKPVQRFIARMRIHHAREVANAGAAGYLYTLPEAGERFSYIIAKTKAEAFDIYGRKTVLKKGDRMEFAAAARALGLEVDVAFYMVSYVVGLCARFINSDAAFQPADAAQYTEKKLDEMSQKAAKKTLDAFIKGLGGVDGDVLKKRGYAYRRAFGAAAAAAHESLVRRVGIGADILHGEWLNFGIFLGGEGSEGSEGSEGAAGVVEALWAGANAYAEKLVTANDQCVELAHALGIAADGSDIGASGPKPGCASNLYRVTAASGRAGCRAGCRATGMAAGMATGMASALDRFEAETRTKLAGLCAGVADTAARYEADLTRLVLRQRQVEHDAHPILGPLGPGPGVDGALLGVTEADQTGLAEFRTVWMTAVGIQVVRRRTAALGEYLRRLKDRRLGVAAAPSRAEREKCIASAAARLVTSGDIALGGDTVE